MEASIDPPGKHSSGPASFWNADPGVQPERASRLQCLDCGLWYRSLERHVMNVHGLSPGTYRNRHELPESQILVAVEPTTT